MSIEQSLNHRIISPPTQSKGCYPIVFLHGLMGFSANWGKIWPKFSDRSVLVFDQRGHGKSFKPPAGSYSPSDYAQDLKQLIDHIGWSKCHIVGHSMGGRVALRFASLYPQSAASLTMEDSGVCARPDRINWINNLLGNIPTPFVNRERAKAFFEANFTHDPMTGGFLHANLEQKESGVWDWRFFPPGMVETIEKGRATDALEEFTKTSLPTLILRGEKSVEFKQDEAEKMCGSRPGVQLSIIPGAGHFVHAEKPTEFCELLNFFINAHDQET
jgi:pimeloyl-ACP methyl ester carboxylesterase